MMSSTADPVNIGNPHEMTMLQFAEAVIAATGSRSKITFRPLPQDDPRQRQPTSLGHEHCLNGTPGVGLTEGLDKTIGYFRQKLAGAPSKKKR